MATPTIQNAVYNGVSVAPGDVGSMLDLFFKPDGTKMYVNAKEYDLVPAWNLPSATFLQGMNKQGDYWTSDGLNMFGIVTSNSTARKYTVSPAWDSSSATQTEVVSVSAGTPRALWLKSDGATMYVLREHLGSKGITQYTLPTPFSVVGNSIDVAFDWDRDIVLLEPIYFFITENGEKLFITASDEIIYEFVFTTPWAVSSLIYSGFSFDASDTVTTVSGMYFKPDGTKMYLSDSTGDTIYEFDLPSTSTKLVLGLSGLLIGEDKVCQYSLENNVGDVSKSSTEIYFQGGEIRKLVSEITNLWCLEGDTPKLFLDGNVEASQTVENGKITVAGSRKIARAAVGLPYTCDIELLDIEAGTFPDTLQGELKKITEVTVRLFKSRMPMVGPTSSQLAQMRTRRNEKFGEASGLLSGDAVVNLPPDWNSNGRIFFRQCEPVPLTILAVFPHTSIEDEDEE